MTSAAENSEEWSVVRKGTSKRMAKSKSRRGKTSHIHLDESEDSSTAETIFSRLEECQKHLKASQFYEDFTEAWKNTTGTKTNSDIQEIVCYGIGTFSQTSNFSGPLWQISFALTMQAFLEKHSAKKDNISMVYYDPLVTSTERQVLKEYNVSVLDVNERGNRKADDPSSILLFFMPHCPKGLYENVLWSNWVSLARDCRAIYILGNSLRTYVERSSEERGFSVPEKDQTTSCLERLQPFVVETHIHYSKKDARDMPGHFEAAFNDTYLTSFRFGTHTTEEGDQERGLCWPERPPEPSQEGQDEVT